MARWSLRSIASLYVVWIIGALPAFGADAPAAPILRVETGMHTTLIRRVVVDAPRNRLISASDDKTIRVWQMPQARLLATLRVPIDAGHEGQLFGLAVSPDGKSVAAGGWTGWDWDGVASLYLFDVESGELIRRVSGFKDAIGALGWSPDGRHLAVGLQARAGLHILRTDDFRIVASDTEYNDKIMDIDFDRGGRLAVVALDGMTRVYDLGFRIYGRVVTPGGKNPASVRFSPDTSMVAIGFADQAVVSVLSTRDLGLQFQADTGGLKEQASFNTVVWSSDGEHLYAGGEYRGAGRNPLYRWGAKGRGKMERIPVADQRISEIQQMPGGAIAYAVEDPGIGILAKTGERVVFRGPDILDFSAAQARLMVSEDTGVISYPTKAGGEEARSFAVEQAGAEGARPKHPPRLMPALTQAAGFSMEGWKDGFSPTINGKALELDDYERSRCYAIAHDRSAVLFGTEWSLRLYDREARQLWRVQLPAVAWAVNLSKGGGLAVAALSDGTIRWYRMRDGREVLAYFPHANGEDWITWTPEGYYASSVRGDNHIGWHLNRGREMTPDFYRAVQFERVLYRPDQVVASFRGAQQAGTRALSREAEAAFDIARLREIAPPRLKLRTLGVTSAGEGASRVKLRLEGEKSGLEMRDYTVFVNSIPVTPARERRLSGLESVRFRRDIEVDLAGMENEIRVEAFNGVSMAVAERFVPLPAQMLPRRDAGELYVLAIGVNEFPKLPQTTYLAYAARDAEEFAKTMAKRGNGYFRATHVNVIADGTGPSPERENIVKAVEFVQQARAADTVVIFLASHGISDKAGNYYFLPRDALASDLDALTNGGPVRSLISWNVFFDALRSAAGRRILIVDTCQARNIEGRFEPHSLMKRSASSLFSLVVASKGDEESQEYPPAKHGLFTYALLSALDMRSDANADGRVSLRELFDSARPLVETLHDRKIGPQTPQLVAPKSLEDSPLMGRPL
jgi:hypothetical protein